MAGIVNDSLMGAIGGFSQGISRGIEDYGRIQAIKEQRELAPLQKGLLQSQLTKAQAEQRETEEKEKWLAAPSNVRNHPRFKEIYDLADDTEKKYLDNALPEGATNRQHLNFFNTLEQNTKGLETVASIGQRKLDANIVDLVNQKSQLENKLQNTPPTVNSAMGFPIPNPALEQLKNQYKEASKSLQDAKDSKEKYTANADKSIVKSMVGDVKMKYKDVFDKVPMLHVMADLAQEKGDVAQLEKLMEVVSKVKSPQIANNVEFAMKSAQKEDGSYDMGKALKVLKELISTPKMSVHIGGGEGKQTNEDKIVKEAKDRFIEEHREDIKSGKIKVPTRGTILKEYYGEKAGEISRDQAPYKPQKGGGVKDLLKKEMLRDEGENVDIDVSGGIEIDPTKFQEK